MTYMGVVYDRFYDTEDNDSKCGGFSTAKEAFEWAKKTAQETGFTHVSYWAEDEETEEICEDFYGTT